MILQVRNGIKRHIVSSSVAVLPLLAPHRCWPRPTCLLRKWPIWPDFDDDSDGWFFVPVIFPQNRIAMDILFLPARNTSTNVGFPVQHRLVFQTFFRDPLPFFVPTQHHWKTFGSSTLGLSGERMSTVLSEKTHQEINFDKTSFLPMYMVTTKRNVRSNYVKSTRQNMFPKKSWGSPNDSVACYQPRWQGMLDALIPKPNICATQTHDSTRDRCSIPWWNPKIFVHPRFCTPRHTNDCENYNCYVNQEENHLGVQHATNPKKVPTILTLPKLTQVPNA